jgi:hypothetical protein
VELHRANGSVRLTVRDDGLGVAAIEEGTGIRGMRERALLAGPRCTSAPVRTAARRCGSTHQSRARRMSEPTGPAPIRILLADDHALVRRGLRLILDSEPDLAVAAEAGDGVEAIELTREHRPDIVMTSRCHR